jgi:hypothetical protein
LSLVTGELRRITPVAAHPGKLEEPLYRYYQLDLFVPLGNQQILLGNDGDREPVRFAGSFGITVLLTELPASLEQARLPVKIRVPCFFVKTWNHKTLATLQVSNELRKPNPVFMGLASRVQVVQASSATAALWWLPAFWGGLAILLAGLFFWTRGRETSFLARDREKPAPDLDEVLGGREVESSLHP